MGTNAKTVRDRLVNRWKLAAMIFMLCLLTGCGYRVAANNRVLPSIQTIAVRPLVNDTTTYEIEQILTRGLVEELVKRTSFQVLNEPERADAILEGRVSRVVVSPVTFVRTAFASTFVVTVYVDVLLKERETGKTLFEQQNHIFREQYVINVDVENFFSEENPALMRIAEDFASSVITTLMEDY